MSVRAQVEAFQEEMLGELPPVRAREILVQLTAHYYACQQDAIKADHAYAVTLNKFLEADEAASRAKIRAETTLEYVEKRQAHATVKFVEEAIRSLKALMRSTEEEMRLSR